MTANQYMQLLPDKNTFTQMELHVIWVISFDGKDFTLWSYGLYEWNSSDIAFVLFLTCKQIVFTEYTNCWY